MRKILEQEGFNSSEIAQIVHDAIEMIAKLAPKSTREIKEGDISSEDYIKFWPFFEEAGYRMDHAQLLNRALAAPVTVNITGPLGRWAHRLSENILKNASVRAAVIDRLILESQIRVISSAAISIGEAFSIHLSEVPEIARKLSEVHTSLMMVSFIYKTPFEDIVNINWGISDRVLPPVTFGENPIRLVRHLEGDCGFCNRMTEQHISTLGDPTTQLRSSAYGSAGLIRLRGQIIGSIKIHYEGHPSLLIFRNVRLLDSDRNILWAGGVYQVPTELVETVKQSLKTSPESFPVIDVDTLTLKPVAFFPGNLEKSNGWSGRLYKDWFLHFQEHLKKIVRGLVSPP